MSSARVALFAMAHFTLALPSALSLTIPEPSGVLAAYTYLSGAGANFGFYAPRVGSPMRIETLIRLRDESNFDSAFDLPTISASDVRDRYDAMAEVARNDEGIQRLQVLGKSLAAAAFDKHPDGAEVRVVIEVLDIPKWADRTSARARFVRVCQMTFERSEE